MLEEAERVVMEEEEMKRPKHRAARVMEEAKEESNTMQETEVGGSVWACVVADSLSHSLSLSQKKRTASEAYRLQEEERREERRLRELQGLREWRRDRDVRLNVEENLFFRGFWRK